MKQPQGPLVPDDFYGQLIAEIPHLRRYARALLRGAGDGDADDLVQACLERALDRASTWQPGTSLRAWVFAILHNRFISDLRRQRVRNPPGVPASREELATPARAEAYVELQAVRRAMLRLPQEQREVILLVGLEGMTYDEVAQVLDVPVGTVRSRLSRGRDALRALVERSRPIAAGQA